MWRRYKEQETHVASSNHTAITAQEPRKGTAASSGVGAVGERGCSGTRGCAGGARTGKGSPVRLEVEHVMLQMWLDSKEWLAKVRVAPYRVAAET